MHFAPRLDDPRGADGERPIARHHRVAQRLAGDDLIVRRGVERGGEAGARAGQRPGRGSGARLDIGFEAGPLGAGGRGGGARRDRQDDEAGRGAITYWDNWVLPRLPGPPS